MTKKIANYEAPRLTVVEFRTERGYATSGDNLLVNSQQYIQGFIDREVENQLMGVTDYGRVVAATLGENEDHTNATSGSVWAYADGGWF